MNILRLLAPPSRLLCALSTMALFGCATLVALQYPTHPQAIPAVQRLTSNDALLVQEARIEIVALGAGAMPELYREMPQASSAAKIRIMEVATKIALPAQMLGVIYARAVQDSDTVVRQSAAFQAARALMTLIRRPSRSFHFVTPTPPASFRKSVICKPPRSARW